MEYRDAVRSIDEVTGGKIRSRLGLSKRGGLLSALERAGLDQCDLVLCLLRMDTRLSLRHVSRIVGKPVTICPPAVELCRLPEFFVRLPEPKVRVQRKKPLTEKDRKVKKVAKRFRQPDGGRCLTGTDFYRRLSLIRVGMTVGAMLRRGLSRRDVRLAVQRGWIKLEAMP